MEGTSQLFVTLFLGALAVFSGIQIGKGIYKLRQHDWGNGLLALFLGIVIPGLILLIGDERYQPQRTGILAFIFILALFIGSIGAQAWLIPLLLDDLGAENVSNVAWGSTLMIAGIGFAMISIQQNDWLTGILGGLFLVILGAAWGVPGIRAILQQAFGISAPEKKSQRRNT